MDAVQQEASMTVADRVSLALEMRKSMIIKKFSSVIVIEPGNPTIVETSHKGVTRWAVRSAQYTSSTDEWCLMGMVQIEEEK